MFPCDLVRFWIGFDGALKVDVVALLDVGRVEVGTQGQSGAWNIWNKKMDLLEKNSFQLFPHGEVRKISSSFLIKMGKILELLAEAAVLIAFKERVPMKLH